MHTASEPPRVLFEGRALCVDAERARASLDAAIEGARPPVAGWTIALRIHGEPPGAALRAEAEITDASGTPVARRALSGRAPSGLAPPLEGGPASRECVGLARAVGVWASLVLDSQARRGHPAPERVSAIPGSDANMPGTPAARASPAAFVASGAAADFPAAGGEERAREAQATDRADATHAPEPSKIELALGTLLMSGTGANALVGVTPSVAVEVKPDVYFRPSLGAAESIGAREGSPRISTTWLTARFDTCFRIPGSYAHNRGLALDLCGGTEAGMIYVEGAPSGYTGNGAPPHGLLAPTFQIGPSVGLDGELGIGCSVALRGIAGLNVIRPEFVDTLGAFVGTPLFSGRIEVALSWRVR